MKNFGICLFLVLLIVGGVGGYFYYKNIEEEKRIEEIKKGWYVEVISDDGINVRSYSSNSSDLLGHIEKGEVYKVLDVDTDKNTYYWYKIEYKGDEAYIASLKKTPWVNDVNNPTDIAVPYIKFDDDVYYVSSIDKINYKHITVIEDTDIYEIKHIVYHEVVPSENKDQYWILYTITDGAGKSSSKMQQIVFAENPPESKVVDFNEYR